MDNSRIEKAIMEYSNTLNTEKDVKTVLESVKAKAEKNYNKETLYKILNCIDITSLHTTDTEKSITEFTEKVNKRTIKNEKTATSTTIKAERKRRGTNLFLRFTISLPFFELTNIKYLKKNRKDNKPGSVIN